MVRSDSLQGRNILLTREARRSRVFGKLLEERGACVKICPFISIKVVEDQDSLDAAIKTLPAFHWLVLTSPSGAEVLNESLKRQGLGLDHLKKLSISSIGPGTTRVLEEMGRRPDLEARQSVSEGLAQAFSGHSLSGKRIFLLRADLARPDLAQALAAAGANLHEEVAYCIGRPEHSEKQLNSLAAEGFLNTVVFASARTVHNFYDAMGPDRLEILKKACQWVSIGPQTSAAMKSTGLPVNSQADPHTLEGLLVALEGLPGR